MYNYPKCEFYLKKKNYKINAFKKKIFHFILIENYTKLIILHNSNNIYKYILSVILIRYPKLVGTEIFYFNEQIETGSEMVFITHYFWVHPSNLNCNNHNSGLFVIS